MGCALVHSGDELFILQKKGLISDFQYISKMAHWKLSCKLIEIDNFGSIIYLN